MRFDDPRVRERYKRAQICVQVLDTGEDRKAGEGDHEPVELLVKELGSWCLG